MSYKTAIEFLPEDKTMGQVYGETIVELMGADPMVIELEADLANSLIGPAMVEKILKKFPKQYVDCGIQEANMLCVAAGLSAVGRIPYIHSFAAFASRRIADQAFISGCYSDSNIRIVGTDPGITSAFNGGTHMPFEDISIYRAFPKMTVLDITDGVMLKDILKQLANVYGMFYIRLFRKNAIRIYELDSTFVIGKANLLKAGEDVTLIAAGAAMVIEALKAAETLAAMGISARVLDMFTIKPLDEAAVILAAKETGAIVTVENHNVINGLGSAVADALVQNFPAPLEKIGVQDEFGEVGPMDYLKERFLMRAEDIVNAAQKAIARKQKR